MLLEPFQNWPFGRPGWGINMKAITPLRYCDFRMSGNEDTDVCTKFAAEILHGMPLCEGHHELVAKAIEDSGVDLVKEK